MGIEDLLDEFEQLVVRAIPYIADASRDRVVLAGAIERAMTNIALAADGSDVPEGSALEERIYQSLIEAMAVSCALEVAAGCRVCATHGGDGCPDILTCTREQMTIDDAIIRSSPETGFVTPTARGSA